MASLNLVILNSFRDPWAVVRQTGVVHGSADRAWILKQVQDDGVSK